LTTLAERSSTDFCVPTGREEVWRFTPLKRLAGIQEEVLPSGEITMALTGSNTPPVGVSLENAEPDMALAYLPNDRTSSQIWHQRTSTHRLVVADDVVIPDAVSVQIGSKGGLGFGHLVIDVGVNAKVSVVLMFDETAQGGVNLQVNLAQGANLTLVQIHDQARTNVWLSDQHLKLGRDSNLLSATLMLGGDLIRLTPRVEFVDQGARAEVLGLYLTGAGQHHENRVLIDHATPKCVSDVLYNGALYGSKARSVWVGDVVVRAAAEGIDTYEMNRNLLLVEDARADSIPNLELETGEVVRAGHASTTGKLDEEQIFYLMGRGVPELEARALIVRGLFASVLQRINNEQVADLVLARLDTAFAQVGSSSALLGGTR
jgi:Fe-S cluster assembly protein SufD